MATAEANLATGWLAGCGYAPPESPDQVLLDIVTPTRNRVASLLEQAKQLGPQLGRNDRWIIVEDASEERVDVRGLLQFVPRQNLLLTSLLYARPKDELQGTVNQARHVGCSLARPAAWIVEIDDHDLLINPDALQLVRLAICGGATLIYGDVLVQSHDGQVQEVFQKPDYQPWLLRDAMCPCEGVRAFPKFLYEAVGGYRWCGANDVGGNEYPAGDYGLYLRIEQLCEGQGFHRIPAVLNVQPKVIGGISTRYGAQQSVMAGKLRQAAQRGELLSK